MEPMKLKENAKTAWAHVLSEIIQSDGIVNQGEIDYLRQVFKVLHIGNNHLKNASSWTLAQAVEVLDKCGKSEKNILLHCIQQLTQSDGDIDPHECLLTTSMLLALGLTPDGTESLQAEIISIPPLDFNVRNTLLYVEPSYNSRVNKALRKEYDSIVQLLGSKGKELFYLPTILKEIQSKSKTFKQMLNYLEPLLSASQLKLIEQSLGGFDTSVFAKELFLNQLNGREFSLDSPAFLLFIDKPNPPSCQDFLLLKIKKSPLHTLEVFYTLTETVMEVKPTPFQKNDQAYMERLTMPPMAGQREEFHYTGFHKTIIDTILKLHGGQRLSRLRVSPKGHLYLVDRNEVEVKIQSLGRALYILFLRHQEGIALTELGDYREELMDIYSVTSDYGNKMRLQIAVDNLINYVGDTMNPLISRIKKSFTLLLGDLAKDYLIEGKVGERKRVNLDRALVMDEMLRVKP